MKLSNSKTNTFCERPIKTPREENISICSCTNCDSFECFALRNKGCCPCKQDKAQKDCQGSKKQVYSNCQSKYSLKTVKISEKDSAFKEHVKKEITYQYNNNNNTVKKHSKYSYNYCIPALGIRDNTDDNRTDLSSEQPTHPLSETVTSSRKEFDTNAAQLSAQIMNVPYKDFTESISHSKPETISPKPTKLSRYDIFRRIKEAYKACSCRVCECLIGKTTLNEYCKCKPCECKDCASLLKKIDYKAKIQQLNLGCPCIRCDRKDCKGVVKKGSLAYCDCDPCDCIKCTDSFTSPCNCQPCECLECRSYSVNKPKKNITLVVASMTEETPRAYCQCSPCDCGECGQDYQMASSLRREMGTGINRPVNCSCDTCVNQSCETHDSNSCTCDIQKRLMQKPVEKDIRDYDIHRALIKNKVIERKSKHNNDTVAMFAAVGNNFLKSDNKNKSCNCGDCECVICSCKENVKTLTKACKCSPCECEICKNTNKAKDILYHNNSCECNVCQCLKCDALSIPSTSNDENRPNNVVLKNMIPTNACKCSLCECIDCQKMMYKRTGDSCYCSSCNCQMCSDQSKLINKAANCYRDNYFSSFKYDKDMTDNYFDNHVDDNTYLTPMTQQPVKKQTIHLNSGQNLGNYHTHSGKELKDTRVLISNNSQFRDHRPCKEKNIIQSYSRTLEYDSSASYISSSSKMLNFQPKLTSIELKNQSKSLFESAAIYSESDYNNVAVNVPLNRCLDDNIGCGIKNDKSFENFHKSIESQNRTIQRFFKIGPNHDDCQHPIEKYPCMTNELEVINSPVSLDKCKDEASPTLCLDNTINTSDESSIGTNINDLSRNLVISLQNANKRLSTLMQPKLPNQDSSLRPSKANISLPMNSIIRRKIIRNNNQENVTSFQNCYKSRTEDFSDIEIDFEKVTNTLQQAKAFSVELTKVLKDYQIANSKLQSKSLKDTIGMNIYSNAKFTNLEQSTYNIEINESINSNAYYEEFVSHVGHDRSPYDPVKKYGSHNLNVTTTNKNKQDNFEMDDKTDCGNKNLLINNEFDHAVDEDVISYKSAFKQQNKENISYQISKENILIDRSSQSDRHIEGDLDEKFKIYKHRSRSNKTQKNFKSGNRLRVPRSLVLYKRLKLKEALINLASATGTESTGTRQNLEPDSFQVNNRALITNSTTQDEQFPKEKRHTTCTSTDMLGSYEHSRFTQPIQADQRLENSSWSILKKNCILNSPYLKNNGFSIIPPLLLEVKDTLRAISRQSGEAGRSDDEVTVTGYGNRALLKLQTEVNRLWESSVPQSSDELASKTRSPAIKSKLDLKAKSFSVASSQTCNVPSSVEKAVDCMDNTFSVTGKSSCDTFKVKFLGLRRVSDHTVLVKWKAPRDVSSVQGYELLVDGRAVQKILSPTRCMAVVTCLPHIERVLITIRTLLPPGLDRPHYPSATIVYQPRVK